MIVPNAHTPKLLQYHSYFKRHPSAFKTINPTLCNLSHEIIAFSRAGKPSNKPFEPNGSCFRRRKTVVLVHGLASCALREATQGMANGGCLSGAQLFGVELLLWNKQKQLKHLFTVSFCLRFYQHDLKHVSLKSIQVARLRISLRLLCRVAGTVRGRRDVAKLKIKRRISGLSKIPILTYICLQFSNILFLNQHRTSTVMASDVMCLGSDVADSSASLSFGFPPAANLKNKKYLVGHSLVLASKILFSPAFFRGKFPVWCLDAAISVAWPGLFFQRALALGEHQRAGKASSHGAWCWAGMGCLGTSLRVK